MNRLTREARLISPDHARIVAAVLRSATSRVLAFADTLGGSTLITDMEQVVRIRSEVDLPVYQSGICTGREHGCGRPDANVRSGATTSASDARFVVPMRFDTTALLGKRPSKPDMPADGAAADFTRGHSGRSTQRPPYCPLSLTLQENDPPATQSAVLGFVFVGTSAKGAAAVGRRSRSFDLRLTLRERRAQVVIIHPTMTQGQNRRTPQPPAPAETGSCGVSARHSSLFGADARAPPRSTCTGVRDAGGLFLRHNHSANPARHCSDNALKFHVFLDN